VTAAPLYLLEGPDGAGKTSLAERLLTAADADGWETAYLHNGPSGDLPGSLYRHYRAQLLEAAEMAEDGVAYCVDRSWVSERVYGPVYRGHSRITEGQSRRLEHLALRWGFTILGVRAEPGVRLRRVRARGERVDAHFLRLGLDYDAYFRDRPSWRIVESSDSTPL
jgi:hypothetical protein